MLSRITIATRHAIQVLKNLGWSKGQISKHLGVSKYETVERWFNRESVKDKPRNQKLISERKLNNIKKDISDDNVGSLRKVAIKNKVSPSKVYKVMRRNAKNKQGMFPYKSKPKLRLTQLQKQQRISYVNGFPQCLQIIIIELKRRIGYDEKPFEIGKSPNRQNRQFWSTNAHNVPQRYQFKDKKRTTIHCFAAINYYKKSRLRFYVKKQRNGIF